MPKQKLKAADTKKKASGSPEPMIQRADVDEAIGEGGTTWERFERVVSVVLTGGSSTVGYDSTVGEPSSSGEGSTE